MNIASIDIGSNTVLLLIASIKNGNLQPLHNEYDTPRLGEGLAYGGNILENKILLLLKILEKYKTIIKKFNCEKTIVTATNAMRIASNSDKIISKVKDNLDLDIKIISGDEEARLSFLGASSALPELKEKMVIDIGGGSTEIIYGNKTNIIFKHSFQVGTVSLKERYFNHFPYRSGVGNVAYEYLIKTFNLLKSEIPISLPSIAVAGTPTTLSCMNQNIKIYDENKVELSTLSVTQLEKLSNILYKLSPVQIKEKYGQVVCGREDVIFAGLLILKSIMEINLLDSIYISGRGIRYGSIINYKDTLK